MNALATGCYRLIGIEQTSYYRLIGKNRTNYSLIEVVDCVTRLSMITMNYKNGFSYELLCIFINLMIVNCFDFNFGCWMNVVEFVVSCSWFLILDGVCCEVMFIYASYVLDNGLWVRFKNFRFKK
jgi:hypothetical protein